MIETFFTGKRIIKKIVIAIVFIFMFNFTFSYLGNNVVFAEEAGVGSDVDLIESEEGELEEGGGKLLLPIHSLLLFLADSCMGLLQNSFLTSEPIILKARSDDNRSSEGIGWIIGGVLITALAVITWITPIPGDEGVGTSVAAAWWAAGAGAKVLSTIALTATVAGPSMIVYGGSKLYKNLQGKFDLPNIWFTPAEIFAGEVPLFDINFFNPAEHKTSTKEVTTTTFSTVTLTGKKIVEEGTISSLQTIDSALPEDQTERYKIADDLGNEALEIALSLKRPKEQLKNILNAGLEDDDLESNIEDVVKELDYLYKMSGVEDDPEHISEVAVGSVLGGQILHGAMVLIQGGQPLEDINEYINNFNQSMNTLKDKINGIIVDEISKEDAQTINDKTGKEIYLIETKTDVHEEITVTHQSTSKILQKTVASMYKTLRTVAIVSLLTILVYVGIKMVLSSASKDKAKYKQMLIDWLVAFIMLFVLHYIMAFVIDICESLTNICSGNDIDICTIEIPGNTEIKDEETGEWGYIWTSESDEGYGVWPTSFVGAIRWDAGLVQKAGFTMNGIAATLMYLVLVIYIIMFSFQYMRRVLYMAFLTMIAPLVAITYPLDKINDGKAQGFSMWLKEYIFNALLQPIHYIIYVIIMGSVMDLVMEHPVYAVVALGFMVPAEKFIRKMFGFEKAATVGGFGAAAGAAALMGGLQKLRHGAHKKKDDDNGAKGSKDNPNGKIRTISAMPEGPGGGSEILPGGPEGGNGILPGGNNIPRPGDPGFIGPLPFGENSTLTTIRNQGAIEDSLVTQTSSSGIIPSAQDSEYSMPNEPSFTVNSPYEETAGFTTVPTPQDNGENIAIPGDPGFIGPMPYEPNTRLTEFPAASDNQSEKPNLFNRARGRMSEIANSPVGQGFRAVGGHYTRRLENRLRKSHPLRALRRGVTYGAGALTLGTIGLAAGIASGDPSKALQYTTAGAAVGGSLGRNLGETASNIVGLEGAVKSFQAGALGDKYNEMERAKYKRDFKRNLSNYDAGVRNVTAKGWRDMSKDGGIIDTGLDYGINNIDDLSNIYKAKEQFRARYNMKDEEAQDWAFKAYKLDQNFGDWGKNSKTRENLDKLLIGKGYTDKAQREAVTKSMVETMGVYQDVSLNKQIRETPADYTRIATPADLEAQQGERGQQGGQAETSGPEIDEGVRTSRYLKPNIQLFGDSRTSEAGNSEEDTERIRTDNRDYNDPLMATPLGTASNNTANTAEETAKRANAESDAAKRETEERKRKLELQEKLEQDEKNKKKAEEERKKSEKRARTEKRRKKSEEDRVKRQATKERNGVLENGEQGSAVRDFEDRNKGNNSAERRIREARTTPVSSDPLTNGEGAIKSNPKKV